MGDFVDWSDVERRCATARQRLEVPRRLHDDAALAADLSDDDDVLSSCAALSDTSDAYPAGAPQSPPPAPPLTPVKPPPLSMTRTAAMSTTQQQQQQQQPDRRHSACTHHNRHHDPAVRRARSVRSLSTTQVEVLLQSLRRLDAVRAQRSSLAAQTADAKTHLAGQQRRLSEMGLSSESSVPTQTEADEREEAVTRRRRELLVRQLRSLDGVNDNLRSRYDDLQRAKAHAVAMRGARLRRHPPSSTRLQPSCQLRRVTDAETFSDIRSLSPIRDVSCLSPAATPMEISLSAPAAHLSSHTVQQQEMAFWLDRQAMALQQQAQLRMSLELAMARERGRQTAWARLCPGELAAGDEAVESRRGPFSPSVQLS